VRKGTLLAAESQDLRGSGRMTCRDARCWMLRRSGENKTPDLEKENPTMPDGPQRGGVAAKKQYLLPRKIPRKGREGDALGRGEEAQREAVVDRASQRKKKSWRGGKTKLSGSGAERELTLTPPEKAPKKGEFNLR